jgi:hypothetical protein
MKRLISFNIEGGKPLRLCSLYLQGCCKRLSASKVDLFTKWLMDIYIVLNRNNLFRDKAVSSLLRERKDNIIGLLVFFFFFFSMIEYIEIWINFFLYTLGKSQQFYYTRVRRHNKLSSWIKIIGNDTGGKDKKILFFIS